MEEDMALSTAGTDVSTLAATHEEADTRIIVHASQTDLKTVVVCARDTDVILLLLHHYQCFKCDEVWLWMEHQQSGSSFQFTQLL